MKIPDCNKAIDLAIHKSEKNFFFDMIKKMFFLLVISKASRVVHETAAVGNINTAKNSVAA